MVLHNGGGIVWAVRKDNPQLPAMLDNFAKKNHQGITLDNTLLPCYLKNTKYTKNAVASEERRKFLTVVEVFHKYGGYYDIG